MAKDPRPAAAPSSRRPAPAGKAAKGPAVGKRRFGRRKARRPRVGAGQIRQAFLLTKKNDRGMLPLVLLVFLGVWALMIGLGVLIDHPVYLTLLGFLVALLAATFTFGRRASKAAFSQVEGQAGAAAAVLTSMRGNWRVQPAVAFTAQEDFVHRVVGRPGIVLVGEGAPHRVRSLLAQEKKKAGRLAGDVPVYDVVVGDEDGQVSLRKLNRHLTKMPRNIKPAAVNILERRLNAMGGPKIPVPKGPVPGRVPRR